MIIYLQKSFSSAHFYTQPAWDEQKNREVFGRCHTPYGHGHNYTLEIGFQSSPESFQQDKQKYTSLMGNLTERLDHEHLNFVIPEFKNRIPTTENIALYFNEKLKEILPSDRVSSIKLFEMSTLWAEIRQ